MKTYKRKIPKSYPAIDNVIHLCRLCLASSKEMIPIFNSDITYTTLALRIMTCVGIEVSDKIYIHISCLINSHCPCLIWSELSILLYRHTDPELYL